MNIIRFPLFLAILIFAATACVSAKKSDDTNSRSPASRPMMPAHKTAQERELDHFKTLIDQALVWRARLVNYYASISESDRAKGHLSHPQLETLHASAQAYLELRKKIYAVIHREDWITNPKAKVTFAPGKGTSFTPHPNGERVVLDPTDAAGALALLRMKMALGSSLALMDNYIYGILPYYENRKIRNLLDQDHPQTRGQLAQITKSYVDPEQRKEMAARIIIAQKELDWRKEQGMSPRTNEELFLELLITQSPTFRYIQESGVFKGPSKRTFIEKQIASRLDIRKRDLVYFVSKYFGNVMGMVQFRSGLLKEMPLAERTQLKSEMRPLDILLEKTPFRLTDYFIPGHWGHVAIWTGSEEQIRDLGIWNDPAIVPHHAAIRSGHRVIEALRPGVMLNTLEHFLDIDDLLVLRHKDLSLAEKREFLIRAFKQLGKEYDFNFDVETDEKIVCSELAYVVYHNVEWPTQKTAGRYTISPDHVAIKGVPGGPLDPVIIYHDGKRMPENLRGGLHAILKMLLDLKYDELKAHLGAQ